MTYSTYISCSCGIIYHPLDALYYPANVGHSLVYIGLNRGCIFYRRSESAWILTRAGVRAAAITQADFDTGLIGK
jgi:hypothetical protein